MIRKILFIIALFPLLLLGSCKEDIKEPEKETLYKVSFETDGGTLINDVYVTEGTKIIEPSLIPFKEGYTFKGWTNDLNTFIEFDFNTLVFSDIILYAIWDESNPSYEFIIDEFIPDEITSSLDLPKTYGDLKLIWSTSDQLMLSNYGDLNRPRTDTAITVTLQVYNNGVITTYEKDVTVKGLTFPSLKDKKPVFGYYSQWNFFGYTDKMIETCDVINLCFAYVTSEHTLDATSCYPVLNEVLKVREKGIRVVLSVQGYGKAGKNFSLAASTKEGRRTLASSMLKFIEKYHLDGIDIDWEYPGFETGVDVSVDKLNYSLLIKEISETLKKANPDYLLTAAIPGGPNGSYRFDLNEVGKYLDYIHVMTYDLQSSYTASHHTALHDGPYTLNNCSVSSSAENYLAHGVPREKIVPGLAFYGKYTYATALGASASGYRGLHFSTIYNDYLLKLDNNITYHFDEVSKAPYILDKNKGIFITFDDERSIREKYLYVLNNNLGGVMIWELGEDNTDILITALNKVINEFK